MPIVTISKRFHVVIPPEIRVALDLEPGQKVQALEYDGRLELIPVRPANALRGFLRGIDTRVPRVSRRRRS